MLTKTERHFIRHALGLDDPRHKTGYRNRFFAGGDDIKTGAGLVKKGMAVRYTGDHFAITWKGFNAVKEPGEKMDREESERMDKFDQLLNV